MKFGKHMTANMPPDWRFNFMDYNGLKHYLKENTTAWNDGLEDKFVTMLEEELKKVLQGPCHYSATARLRHSTHRFARFGTR